MAGHSHWARIKRKKGVTDARRGRLWSKLARAVIMAARQGGGDPGQNLTLRYAIDKAKGANMPNDTIDRAVKKGTGELGGAAFENVVYEGYAPGGVAIMVECLTDNRNRTASEIRKIFELRNSSLGTNGCVSYLFSTSGVINVKTADATEEKLMELTLDAGAEDIQQDEDEFEITCSVAALNQVKEALEAAEIPVQQAQILNIPSTKVTLDTETGKKVLAFMEALDDNEDVQNVSANFDLPEEVMAQIE